MNKPLPSLLASLFALTAAAQNVEIFPDEYAAVAEGPLNSPNLPFATGTARVQLMYEVDDLSIPIGNQITKIGFREDGTLSAVDLGRTLQVEVRIGYTTHTAATLTNNFDNNFAATPTTVFGPGLFTLPDLRDGGNPLPNGEFFMSLTTPFVFQPPAGENLLIEYRLFGNSSGGTSWNYRIDRADWFADRNYGPVGCPHSGGNTPDHTIGRRRWGQTYSASVAQGPGTSPCVLAINIGANMLPPYDLGSVFGGIPSACTGQMSPVGLATLGGTTNGAGSKTWTFGIPNSPVWADTWISSQVLCLDFFSPGGIVVSNGGEMRVGKRPRCTVVRGNGAPTTVTTGTVTRNYCPVALFEHQ